MPIKAISLCRLLNGIVFFWRPINLWKRFIFHSDSCSDWMPLSGANVPVLLSQLTDTLNSCMVRISLHSMEEINDCNSTLLSVENVSQKMSQNFSYI